MEVFGTQPGEVEGMIQRRLGSGGWVENRELEDMRAELTVMCTALYRKPNRTDRIIANRIFLTFDKSGFTICKFRFYSIS